MIGQGYLSSGLFCIQVVMKTLNTLKLLPIRFVLFLLLIGSSLSAQDKIEIKGKIIDFETKEPVAFCAVALSGTSLGSITDEAGRYTITDVPRQPYEIVASHIAYQNKVLRYDPDYPRPSYNMSLRAKVTELETVAIETRGRGKIGRLKRRNIEQFKKLVFGAEYRDSEIEIKNEEVLDFKEKFNKLATSNKTYDLDIANYHLGYEITYLNLGFKVDGSGKMFIGNPIFRPMEPENEEEAQKWKKNRELAYKGSLKHFFHTLVNGELDYGDFLANLTNDDPSQVKRRDFKKTTEQLRLKATKRTKPNVNLKFNEKKGYYDLKYKDILEIFYMTEDGRTKQSYLKMNARSVQIYPSGALRNPLAVIVFGELANKGVYQMLPSNYQPEN